MERTLEKLGVSATCAELAWISKEQKHSWNLLKPTSFDVWRNAITPMIVILGYSEIDTQVSDTNIRTIRSDDCKEMSGDNRNTNNVLAITQKRARFSCKDKYNINSFTQSISGLC